MVTIVKQSRFSLWRYQDIFEFPLPPRCHKPLNKILAFYEQGELTNVVLEPLSLRFTRGRVLMSFWNSNDPRAKQNVCIRIVDGVVRCEFSCFSSLGHFQILKSSLNREMDQLEAFLGGAAIETVPKRKIVLINPFLRLLYWCYRIASGTRYRARRRLTRAGWMLLIGLMASMMMGTDPENTVVYQAMPILVFLLLTAACFSFFFRARFSATRLLPRFGTVGQPLYYRVMIKNLTAKAQSDLTYLENLSDPRPSYRDWKAAVLADNRKIPPFRVSKRRAYPRRIASVKEAEVPAMAPKGEAEVRVELEPLRRGVLSFGGATL